MKILVTADTHYGATAPTVLEEYMRWASNKEQPDVVVIAGDVAEVISDPEWFYDCLTLFKKWFQVPVLVVPGNHDLWTTSLLHVCQEFLRHDSQTRTTYFVDEIRRIVNKVENGTCFTSKQLIDDVLPKLTRNAGCHWLESENWVENGVAIVGSYLHYDYSAQDKTGVFAGMPVEYLQHNKANVNNDGKYLVGLPDDRTFANQLGEQFKNRLVSAEEDPQVSSILIATHVPCLERQITRRPMDLRWSSGTPYMGNLSHQQLILGCSKVRYVISGHQHQGVQAEISRDNLSPIMARSLDAHYGSPAHCMAFI